MDFSKWTTTNPEQVFHINLYQNGKPVHDEAFEPLYTYFIFDQTEDIIFGYSEPRIDVAFRATDMKPSVKVSYKQKINIDMPGLDKFVELEKVLAPFFSPEAFEGTSDKFEESGWTPPGELLHKYKYDGQFFEIWHASLLDRKAIEIVRNMKVLIPMFIEGGTYGFLDDDEDEDEQWATERWKVFFLYQVDNAEYSLAGFSTSYSFSVFQKPSESDATPDTTEEGDLTDFLDSLSVTPQKQPNSARERISQFLIFPPYQHQPHGIYLYQTMIEKFTADPAVFEITVEDPNEHFDNLRDYCDLSTLLADPTFSSLKPVSSVPDPSSLSSKSTVPINAIIPSDTVTKLCARHKLVQRQVEHLIELYILQQIPRAHRSRTRVMSRKSQSASEDDRKYYFWRLLVKWRVYIRNKEELKEVEENERVEKIESAVDSLQEQYEQLMAGFERRVESGFLSDASKGLNADGGAERQVVINGGAAKKRKIVESSSDDDDEAPAKRQATEPLA